jgi:hypothetical protein
MSIMYLVSQSCPNIITKKPIKFGHSLLNNVVKMQTKVWFAHNIKHKRGTFSQFWIDYSLLATCILFSTQQCSDLSKFNSILKSPTIPQLEHVNQMWFEVHFCLFLSKTNRNIHVPNCITIYCTTTCNKNNIHR